MFGVYFALTNLKIITFIFLLKSENNIRHLYEFVINKIFFLNKFFAGNNYSLIKIKTSYQKKYFIKKKDSIKRQNLYFEPY